MFFEKIIKHKFSRKLILFLCIFTMLFQFVPLTASATWETTEDKGTFIRHYVWDTVWVDHTYKDVWVSSGYTSCRTVDDYSDVWVDKWCTDYTDVWVDKWCTDYRDVWVNYWEDGKGNWGGGYYQREYYEVYCGEYERRYYEVYCGEYERQYYTREECEYVDTSHWERVIDVHAHIADVLVRTYDVPKQAPNPGTGGGGTGGGSSGNPFMNPAVRPTDIDLSRCSGGDLSYINTSWVYTGYCAEIDEKYAGAYPSDPVMIASGNNSAISNIWSQIQSMGDLGYYFAKGVVEGIYSSIKGTYELVRHPIDTLNSVYEMIVSIIKWIETGDTSFIQPLIDVFGNAITDIYNSWVNGSGNDRAEIVGKFIGETAVSVIGAKGANVVLKSIKLAKINRLVPCNCFTAGTKVLTVDGEKSIEQVVVGDMVLAKNPDTGELAYKEVDLLFQKEITKSWNIIVGDEVITTTDEHPFWIHGKGWVVAKDLIVGDLFETSDGSYLAVDRIEVKEQHTAVYNFRVKDFHTYYVSNLKILTHNSNCITPQAYNTYTSGRTSVIGSYTTTSDSGILRAQLLKAGVPKPDKNWAAHHIVPVNDARVNAIRTMLGQFNIELNSASNGVFLPRYAKLQYIEVDMDDPFTGLTERVTIATHNGNHWSEYTDKVIDAFESVTTKDQAIVVINDLRDQLLRGQIFLQAE